MHSRKKNVVVYQLAQSARAAPLFITRCERMYKNICKPSPPLQEQQKPQCAAPPLKLAALVNYFSILTFCPHSFDASRAVSRGRKFTIACFQVFIFPKSHFLAEECLTACFTANVR